MLCTTSCVSRVCQESSFQFSCDSDVSSRRLPRQCALMYTIGQKTWPQPRSPSAAPNTTGAWLWSAGRWRRRELDLLFVTDPSNMAWLTGYDGWSFYVHQGVIVPGAGDPLWWGRGQDANGARRTVFMPDERIFGYADRYVQSAVAHPMEDLARRVAALGGAKARIGVEMDNYYYCAKAHAVLAEALPDAVLDDATALVNWQRGVKSAEEIAFMRKAARIAERIVRTALDTAEPGLPKNRLVAAIQQAAVIGRGRRLGRLSGHRAALALGRRCRRAASDLERRAAEDRRGDVLRARRLLSPLSRAALPHCAFRPAARPHDPRLRGADRRPRGRHRGGARRQPRLRRGERAPCRAAQVRHRTRRPLRLSGRAELSARLGRAHHFAARQRRDGAQARHDLPFHAGAVDGRLGAGDHRDHPDPRATARPRRCAGWHESCSSSEPGRAIPRRSSPSWSPSRPSRPIPIWR